MYRMRHISEIQLTPRTSPGGSYRELECFDSSAAADDGRLARGAKAPRTSQNPFVRTIE